MIIPLNHHVQIEPIKQVAFLSADNPYDEKGVVLSVADSVVRVKEGDIVFFDSWLVSKYEGSDKKLIYLVPEESIRAKEVNAPLPK